MELGGKILKSKSNDLKPTQLTHILLYKKKTLIFIKHIGVRPNRIMKKIEQGTHKMLENENLEVVCSFLGVKEKSILDCKKRCFVQEQIYVSKKNGSCHQKRHHAHQNGIICGKSVKKIRRPS